MTENDKLELIAALVILQKICHEHTIKKWNTKLDFQYDSCDNWCPLLYDHWGNCSLNMKPPRDWNVNDSGTWFALFNGGDE